MGQVVGVVVVGLAVGAAGCKRDPNVEKQKYLESGKRYEKDGKQKEAVIQFANALKVDKNFGEAHFELGKTYLAMGNAAAAYRELMRAVDLGPSNAAARIELGTLLSAARLPDRANEQAKAVLAMDPNNADGYALLSQVDEQKGDHAGAIAQIEHALQIDPKRANFHTQLGILESVGGGVTGGSGAPEQELERAVSLDPKSTSAHLVLAAMLEKKGDRAGAEKQDQLAVEESPKNLGAYVSLGALYLRAGNKDKAEETFRKATEALPDTEVGAGILKDYYQRTGQMERAEPAYADLVAKQPKSVPLKIVYARVLLQKPDVAKAQGVVDELNKKNSGNPQVEVLTALLLMNSGKLNDAYSLVQKGTKNAPDNVQLQLLLAQLAGAKGDLTAAQAAYTQAARIEPANLVAQAGLARIADRRKDYSTLAQLADKVIAQHPEFADAYLWRGTARANQKQDGAEGDFRTAIQKNPDNAVAYVELGLLLLRGQRIAEGKAMMEQAVQHDPNQVQALRMLVGYDLAAKDPGRAKARIVEQVGRSPKNPALYSQLAMLELQTGDVKGAQDSAAKAMQVGPGNQEAVATYAQTQLAQHNLDGAIGTWQQWANAHPSDAGAMTELGMLESGKGETDKAMEYYKKALQIDPQAAPAANNLAYLMVEHGQNVDVALSLAQTARRGMPHLASSADTLAWVYYYKGTYGSARDLLEDALKEEPNNAAMHYHLGMVYSKLNDKADAETHLKKAAGLGVGTETGKDAQAALSRLG